MFDSNLLFVCFLIGISCVVLSESNKGADNSSQQCCSVERLIHVDNDWVLCVVCLAPFRGMIGFSILTPFDAKLRHTLLIRLWHSSADTVPRLVVVCVFFRRINCVVFDSNATMHWNWKLTYSQNSQKCCPVEPVVHLTPFRGTVGFSVLSVVARQPNLPTNWVRMGQTPL